MKVTQFAFFLIFYLANFFFVTKAISQTSISVNIFSDSSFKETVENCSVTVLESSTSKIVFISNTNGALDFTLQNLGSYKIIVTKENYQNIETILSILKETTNKVNINIILSPFSKTLSEVVVTSKVPPIIVKGDTIIYNTAHFTMPADDNLEDILKHIPDIEVLENGDIKVKGKLVNKVVINGKEISNLGAAIITKSISPEMIKNIEIRLKDRDTGLKESLLSNNDVIILDIKLKDKIHLPFFGRSKIFEGYQNNNLLGGYANLFSLHTKNKFQLLAEYDQFGNRTIGLEQLKNIDKESYESIFDLPASFSGMKQKQEFDKEIYGFKDFTIYQPALIALTFKKELSKYISLSVGTYNAIDKELLNTVNKQSFFSSASANLFSEEKTNNSWLSKNKIELLYNPNPKHKIEYSLLFTSINKTNSQNNFNNARNTAYNFLSKKNESQFTQNLKFEYIFNNKFAFSFTNQIYCNSKKNNNLLLHNDTSYNNLLIDENNNLVEKFKQNNVSTNNGLLTKLFLQIKPKKYLQTRVGIKYSYNNLLLNKEAFNNQTNYKLNNSYFTYLNPNSFTSNITPYIENIFYLNKITFETSLGLAFIKTNFIKNSFRNYLLEYKFSVNFKANDYDNLALSLRQNITPIEQQKQSFGYDLLNFQTVGIPNTSTANPQYEHVVQLTYYTSILASLGITTDIATIYGDTKNTDKFATIGNSFSVTEYDQQKATYAIISNTFTKIFDKHPYSIKFETNFIKSSQENNANNQIYNTYSKINSYELTFFSIFENKKFDFKINSHYQIFTFNSDIAKDITKQKYLSNELIINYSFLKKKGLLRLKLKETEFLGAGTSKYTNLFVKAQYKFKKINIFLEIDNLFNNKYFFKNDIFPTYETSNRINTFNRYLKLGIEIKFL